MRLARLVAAIAASCLVGTLLGPVPAIAVPAAGRHPAPVVPALDWQSCGEEFPGVQCATATVPLDYDRPHARTTEVALARVPASDQAHRLGSVFVNPGGPGGSGVGLVLSGFGGFLADQLNGRFDVVGFDPRGVGASDPLHCFGSEEELDEHFEGLPVFPYRRGQYAPFFSAFRALGKECHDDREAIVDQMSTADVVRDLDLLRRAVGDRKLSYLGFSYGSYIGNTYANLFPNKVRALVIDGVLDPRLWSSGWQIVSDRVATQEEFEEFLRLCDAARSECAFATEDQSSRARWEHLAREIRRHPLPLGDDLRYTYDRLILDAGIAMYDPSSWGGPEGFGAYFDAIADAALGDATPAGIARLRAELLDKLTLPAQEADYDNAIDAYYGNQCADTQYPSTLGAFVAIDRYAAHGSRFGPWWWWQNAGCADWPVNKDRYAGPWTTRTSAPVLVVGNFFDGVTDYRGAQASARLLDGRLLSYAGWGHTAYGTSACATADVNAYLLNGTLPPRGKVCPANPNPFLQSALRAVPGPRYVGMPPAWLLQR